MPGGSVRAPRRPSPDSPAHPPTMVSDDPLLIRLLPADRQYPGRGGTRTAMEAFYEVWDFETRNIVHSVETEAAATLFLRRLLDLNGPDGIREMGVVRQAPDASGEYEPALILDGHALLGRLSAISSPGHPKARRTVG